MDIWLIPRGEQSFEMTGYYGNRVVDLAFKEAFLKYYHIGNQFECFDIWQCSKSLSVASNTKPPDKAKKYLRYVIAGIKVFSILSVQTISFYIVWHMVCVEKLIPDGQD